ncbi:MAG: UDP-glucose 4-epimerase GalE [Sneathiellaceae bacterium]
MADRILVTGGAGFVGSHVCKALAGAGLVPITYDDLSGGNKEAIRWGPLVTGDLADRDKLDFAMTRFKPRAVIHLAGVIAAGESVADPAKYYRINVVGSLELLGAMRRHGVDAAVFSSSAAVYGDAAEMPVTEDAAIQPTSPYGRTKAAVEGLLQDYVAYGLRSISLRYFNAAGADPDGELGELHEPETHLIPLVLEAAAGIRDVFEIYGTDYPTPDGTCIRDYVHVSDLARAHVLALERLARPGRAGAEAFNLGSGKGASVQEVIAATERVTGLVPPTRNGPRRPGDPARLVADPTRAMQQLGWQPRHDDLDTQIGHAWAFLDSRMGRRLRRAG